MSVNYRSALIYGYKCSPEDWSWDSREKAEELGLDVISDPYADNFLYIGKAISKTSAYDEVEVNCLENLQQAENDLQDILQYIPEDIKQKLPLYKSLYHLCYAT